MNPYLELTADSSLCAMVPAEPLSRRKFCAMTASATALALAPTRVLVAAPDQTPRFQLNYILSAAMYGTMPLEEVLGEVKKTGAKTVDVWPLPHGNHREQMDALGFERVEKLFDEHDVRLGVITRYDLGPYHLHEEFPVLTRFGGKLLVCGAEAGPGESEKERIKHFVESMKPHVESAAEKGITIGIENHSSTVLDTPTSIRYFAEVNRFPNFGIALAPYHLPQDPQMIASLIEDLGPNVVFFQAWEHGKGCMEKLPKDEELMQLPGRGNLDFVPILAALRKINYGGWTEIFMHPVPRGIPILETAHDVTAEINRARDYLEDCLTRLPA